MTRVIWKSNKKGSNYGYLRLSTRVGNKTKIKSLGLEPIHKRFFNSKEGRIRKSHPNSEELNQKIEEKLKEVRIKGNSFQYLNDDSKSFMYFFQTVIDRTVNQGTKTKYKNIYNLVGRFNEQEYGGLDVKFKDITVDFILRFKKWMMETNKNTLNTSNYKLKTFQSIVNKGINEGVYHYHPNPFKYIKYKFHDSKVDILSKTDLEKLMNTPLVEVYRGNERFGEIITNKRHFKDPRYEYKFTLDEVRSYFLFQLFCQGIRVSDLMTLRWNNFYQNNEDLRIRKRMIKTKHEIDLIVNDYCLDILCHQLKRNNLFKDETRSVEELNKLIKSYSKPVDGDTVYSYEISLFDVEHKTSILGLGFEEFHHPETSEIVSILLSKNEIEQRVNEYNIQQGKDDNSYVDFYDQNKYVLDEGETIKEPLEDEHYIPDGLEDEEYFLLLKIYKNILRQEKWEINDRNKHLTRCKNEKRSILTDCIIQLSKSDDKKNSFCFPLLNDEDFTHIDERNDFGTMNDREYKRFQNGRVYYNRLLKVVSSQCGLSLVLTSHISRHSYTSLMLEIGENINLFDVMTSLGHKHLDTTQKYLQRFNHQKIDILNKQLSDYISKK